MLHMRNAPLLLALNQSSWNLSPTRWQKHLFPELYQKRTTTIHEGINLTKFVRRPGGQIEAPDGAVLRDGMEIVTFIARYLEPVRGFYTFMRAAGLILKERPNAHVVIVGGENGHYGTPLPGGQTHKETMLQELNLDLSRVHFLDYVGQSTVVKLLGMARVHIFLTYPFLISWSVLEALACGCVVLASNTGPAQEIITHGVNGMLLDFFDHGAFASAACDVLEHPERYKHLGVNGRLSTAESFDALKNVKRQVALVTAVASGEELPEEEVVRF